MWSGRNFWRKDSCSRDVLSKGGLGGVSWQNWKIRKKVEGHKLVFVIGSHTLYYSIIYYIIIILGLAREALKTHIL